MPNSSVVHVIDDDEAVRESLEFLLRTAHFTVQTYDSAVAFLAALPAGHSGCIITDVRMPDMSGIDLLRRLKELGNTTPVIVITGHGDVPLAVEAMKIGAADFLEKPFDDQALIAAIRAALNRDREREREGHEARIIEFRHRIASLTALASLTLPPRA
jgi:two-component system response regulator FixJ